MKTLDLRPGGRWQLNDRQHVCVLDVQGERVMLGLPSSAVPASGPASDDRAQPLWRAIAARRPPTRSPGYFWFRKGGPRMFVTQARPHQEISIDDDTSVVVLEVRPDCVRIGFIDSDPGTTDRYRVPQWVD